jgi:hypothetical protein
MAVLLVVLYSKESKFKLFQIIETYKIIKKKDMCRNTIQEKININIDVVKERMHKHLDIYTLEC